ncbi:MAG: hypothetical protein DLM72_00800 [Candidatus Nitrosopolaris wilkensis]|nr:MAG: hypothetical protein DLM72_00800 [Candidatus Nitrosopolaris wilkensis]
MFYIPNLMQATLASRTSVTGVISTTLLRLNEVVAADLLMRLLSVAVDKAFEVFGGLFVLTLIPWHTLGS